MLTLSDRHRLKKALVRNMRIYGVPSEPGQFTSILISLMKEYMRRPESRHHMSEVEYVVWANSKKTPIKVGTPAWIINQQKTCRLTDLYLSEEAYEDMINWSGRDRKKMYDELWRKFC